MIFGIVGILLVLVGIRVDWGGLVDGAGAEAEGVCLVGGEGGWIVGGEMGVMGKRGFPQRGQVSGRGRLGVGIEVEKRMERWCWWTVTSVRTEREMLPAREWSRKAIARCLSHW